MSCETLEFSLSVVAVRHLCILTHTGLPSPQSGESEVQHFEVCTYLVVPICLIYIRTVAIRQTQKFSLICVIESRFSLVFVVFLSNT